jgi:hypothetical protein
MNGTLASGVPDAGKAVLKGVMSPEEFAYRSRLELDPENPGCLRWCGKPVTSKYRKVAIGDKLHEAHRLAYTVTKGDPGDNDVHHTCENTKCVNPGLLILLSRADHARQHTVIQFVAGNKANRNGRKIEPLFRP